MTIKLKCVGGVRRYKDKWGEWRSEPCNYEVEYKNNPSGILASAKKTGGFNCARCHKFPLKMMVKKD